MSGEGKLADRNAVDKTVAEIRNGRNVSDSKVEHKGMLDLGLWLKLKTGGVVLHHFSWSGVEKYWAHDIHEQNFDDWQGPF